jgi:hypothetical protein
MDSWPETRHSCVAHSLHEGTLNQALHLLRKKRMSYDQDKIEETVLALLGAFEFDQGRVWKRYDFAVMDALHAKGLIDNPRNRNESVRLTDEGIARAKALARRYFGDGES